MKQQREIVRYAKGVTYMGKGELALLFTSENPVAIPAHFIGQGLAAHPPGYLTTQELAWENAGQRPQTRSPYDDHDQATLALAEISMDYARPLRIHKNGKPVLLTAQATGRRMLVANERTGTGKTITLREAAHAERPVIAGDYPHITLVSALGGAVDNSKMQGFVMPDAFSMRRAAVRTTSMEKPQPAKPKQMLASDVPWDGLPQSTHLRTIYPGLKYT